MNKKKIKKNNYCVKLNWCKIINNVRKCKNNPNAWRIVTFRTFTSYFTYNGKEIRRKL